MKNARFRRSLTGAASLAFAFSLAACASGTDSASGAARSSVAVTEDAAADAFGLPRERPGGYVIDEGDATVPTPYGGSGAEPACLPVARDIARLTVVPGADLEARASAAEDEEESLRQRGGELVEDAPEVAEDVYRSAIVGLNPARPVIRFLGQAGEIEREARRERELALKRRAYLRGRFDAMQCEANILAEAAAAYGLSEPAMPEAE
jgi:hypothetical protein